MNRTFRFLHHFLEAARAQNLHHAAKKLSLTQSALSKSIAQLEANLGVKLFERSVRGVTLTKSGDMLYERANRVEAECALMERELSEIASGHAGHLTISAGPAWSSVYLPQILLDLKAGSPSAKITVLRSYGPHFSEQFANGEIDMGLGFLDAVAQNDDEYVYEPLSIVEVWFFANKNHVLNSQPEVVLKDLLDYSWVMFRMDNEVHKRIGTLFVSNNLAVPDPAIWVDSLTTALELLRRSDAITCIPAPLASLAEAYDVHPLPVNAIPWTFQSGVMYRKSSLGYPLLEEMLSLLRETYAIDAD